MIALLSLSAQIPLFTLLAVPGRIAFMNSSTLSDSLAASFDDPTKDRLLGILAAGVPQTAAALAVGVSDSYVSQLLDDPAFSEALAAKRSKKVEASIRYEDTVESVRSKALTILESKLSYVRSPMEAARIFAILDGAKKTTTSAPGEVTPLGMQQVAIVLPKAAQVMITMNSANQVIDVQGRSMATLPSRALPALSKEQASKKEALALADQTAATDVLATMVAARESTTLKKVPNLFTAEDL